VSYIVQHRSVVADLLERHRPPELEVHPFVPLDLNAYPCWVVGRPSGTESLDAPGKAFDSSVPVYACGRQQSDDAQDELDKSADLLLEVFGGAGQRSHAGLMLAVTDYDAITLAVGSAAQVPAYVLTVSATIRTDCQE
jgi:hypothetical protein